MLLLFIQHDGFNEVEIYKRGILTYKFKDIYVAEKNFIRDFGNKNTTSLTVK